MSDDKKAIWETGTIAISGFRDIYMSDLDLISFSGSDAEAWLPAKPLDVDARVYKELGEREFKHWDHDNTMPLADFIAELLALAAKAPKNAAVVIELGAATEYDDSYANPSYEVGYFRDLTKRERAEREETNRKIAARDKRRAEAKIEKERAEFERLSAKYGTNV